MSTLTVISVDNNTTAQDALERVLHLHTVVLLTLEGCSLLHRRDGGDVEVVAAANPGAGSAHFDEDPAFRALVAGLSTLPQPAAGQSDADSGGSAAGPAGLFDSAGRDAVARSLAPGRWSVVFLAHSVAQAEVALQLESLGGEIFSLPVTVEDKDAVLASFA